MATTTPNFGWSVPTSTDLVKDGATAIETLGDAIDASLVDLKGGTSGQVLSKASNTDMDFTWIAAGASGSVIKQMVTASTTTSTQIASTTLTDTTLTATITPTSASSKILVLITQQFAISRSGTNIGAKYKVFRDATTIVDYSAASNNYAEIDQSGSITATKLLTNHSISYLDSPASTSALVYKTQGACNNTADSGRVTFQIGSAPSLITLIEIG